MASQPFFSVTRQLREDIKPLLGRLAKCKLCPFSASCSSVPEPIAVPVNFNGVVILYDRPFTGEARAGLEYYIRTAGLRVEDTIQIAATVTPCDQNMDNKDVVLAANKCSNYLYTRLAPLIEARAIKVIVAVGYASLHALYVNRIADHRLLAGSNGPDVFDLNDRWRGWQIPDGLLGAYVCPVYGYPLIDDSRSRSAAKIIFRDDFQSALRLLLKPQPVQPDYEKSLVYGSLDEINGKRVIRELVTDPSNAICIAIDYETTGLKPHRDEHSIACVSFCADGQTAYCYPLDGADARDFTKRLLLCSKPKIAANLKFEEAWSRECLRVRVNNWYWDTMLMAHLLDNRDAISGVKFQSFVRFGLVDYNSHLKADLESAKTANDVNNVYGIPQSDLLQYCAMDSLLEYRIAMQQIAEWKVRTNQ